MRLTQANLNNDDAALDECAALLEPVRSAWLAIGPAAARRARQAAMNMPRTQSYGARMNSVLLNYYEAIEKASQDMLERRASATGTRSSSSRAPARC